MIYFAATLIVIAFGLVVVWDIYAACFNFIYRDEIKREAEQRCKELNAYYLSHTKKMYT